MLSNKEIKWITSLKNKKYRHIHGAFIAEGPKLVNDLLINGLQPLKILKVADYILLKDGFEDKVVQVDNLTLKKLSLLQHPNQILAVFEMPKHEPIQSHPKGSWGVALDFIQDPGNLGTILRTMNYLGIEHIYLSEDSVDVYNPKVVQATMGAIGRLPVNYVALDSFLNNQNVPIYITEMGGTSINEADLTPGIIVFGNEGNGVRETIKQKFLNHISIPKLGEGESLNLAISTAIIGAWIKMKHH